MEYSGSDDGIRRDGSIASDKNAVCLGKIMVWLSQ